MIGEAFRRHVKADARSVEPRDVLTAPPTALVGVSEDGAKALAALGVATVFDLAASAPFARAATIAAAANGAANGRDAALIARFGRVPSDMVDSAHREDGVAEIAAAPPDVLLGVGASAAAKLAAAFGIGSVSDMAALPAYRAALAVVSDVLSVDAEESPLDPEAPDDLIPRSRDYPTERVYYETLVLDRFLVPGGDGRGRGGPRTHVPDPPGPPAVPLETLGPIDVLAAAQPGYPHPALGAILRFSQSWFVEGVALGHLLHSVALAPGESTRIAMVDWSRRTSGRQTDTVEQTEALANVTGHNRAISEVTSAVATESQQGFSRTRVKSSSEEAGLAGGGVLPTPGIALVGGSYGTAESTSEARGFSSSEGRRDLAASMTQQINEATQQAANSARNRRASVVREVSEQEQERVSTRVVANYNHMHALSVQYYEIVQLYRVVTELERVDRCVFVPLQLLDFGDPTLVRRYRRALIAAALDERVAAALAAGRNSVAIAAPALADGTSPWAADGAPALRGRVVQVPADAKLDVQRTLGGASSGLWLSRVSADLRDGRRLTHGFGRPPSGPGKPPGGETGNWPMSGPALSAVDVSSVRRLTLEVQPLADSEEQDAGTVRLQFAFGVSGGAQDAFGAVLHADVPAGGKQEIVLDFEGGTIVFDEALEHLDANRVHYSQAVWRSLTPVEIAAALAHVTLGGRRLLELIDSVPADAVGNYLAFRLRVEDDERWETWLEQHGIVEGHRDEDLVPIPSGGVFAEAVLGRSNSAEKIDLTRFWDWQESPIPLTATEIAPIQTGSRHADEPLQPGQLAAPMVNIVNPTPLPDPQGLAATIAAISNGGMFRDMSGLAAVAGLAQAGLAASSQGASHASDAAAANMKTMADLLATIASIAAGVPVAGLGLGGGGGAPARSNTGTGGLLNYGREADARAAQAPPPAATSGGGAVVDGPQTPREDEAFAVATGKPPKSSGTTGGSGTGAVAGTRPRPKQPTAVRVSIRAFYPNHEILDGTFNLAFVDRATGESVAAGFETSYGVASADVALRPGTYLVVGQVWPQPPAGLSASGDIALVGGDTLQVQLPLAVDATGQQFVKPTGQFTVKPGVRAIGLRAVPDVVETTVHRTIQLEVAADGSAEFKQELQGKLGASIEVLELELAGGPSLTVSGSIHAGAQQSVQVDVAYSRITGMVFGLDKEE